jgi:hypothetical protein
LSILNCMVQILMRVFDVMRLYTRLITSSPLSHPVHCHQLSSSPLSSTLMHATLLLVWPSNWNCESSHANFCLQTLINSHRRLLGLKWSYDLRFMFMFWIQIPNQIFNPNLDSKTSSNPNSNHKSNHNCNSYLANSLLCSTVISFKTFIPIFNIDQWQAVTRVGF